MALSPAFFLWLLTNSKVTLSSTGGSARAGVVRRCSMTPVVSTLYTLGAKAVALPLLSFFDSSLFSSDRFPSSVSVLHVQLVEVK